MRFFSYKKNSKKIKIILLGLIIGIIYVSQQIMFIIEMKKDRHFFFIDASNEEPYIGRVREVYDSRYLITDAYIYENKSKPYIRTFLSELTMGLIGKISNLSINWLFILADFIFPVIIFYLVLYFLFIITKSLDLSLFGSVFVVLGDFVDIIYLWGRSNPILTFVRLINPQIHFIYFMLSLIFTYKALKSLKVFDIALGGLLLGLLFYTYPYFWSYFLTTHLLLLIYFIIKKDFIRVKTISYIIIEGLIISIPYWINYLYLSNLPYYSEVVTRFGLFNSHRPLILKLPLISIILFLVYKKRDFNFYFIFSLLVSTFLCLNQQVITGKELEPPQWYWCPGRQIAIMSWFILMYNFVSNREAFLKKVFMGFNYKRLGKYLLFILLILNVIIHSSRQLHNYERAKEKQKEQQFLYEPFLWLNNHTNKDDVILASGEVSLLIPLFTHNNVYRSPCIYESVMSDSEIIDRFFIFTKLFGLSESENVKYVINHTPLVDVESEFFGNRSLDPRYRNKNEFFALNKIEDKLSDAYQAIEREDIYTLLRKFRLDYVFYGPYEKQISDVDLDKYPFLEKVYDKDNIQIYHFIKNN